MACLSSEELAAACDGALSRGIADRVREHLSICPRCAQEVVRLSRILTGVAQGTPPSEALLQRAKSLGKINPTQGLSASRLTRKSIQKTS